MRYIAPRIGEEQARARLRPRRAWLRWRRDGGAGALEGKRLPHLELVWLPFLYAETGERRSCLVCASTGIAARLERSEVSFTQGGEVSAGAIDRNRLVEAARSHLARLAALAGRSTPRAHEEELVLDDWALSFWVLLFERSPGRLDFVALDATSGAKVGGAVRQALLRAMLARPADGLPYGLPPQPRDSALP